MPTALLDTSIIVDLLRNYEQAEIWLQDQTGLGVSDFVWFEVLNGTRTKLKQNHAIRLLSGFELIEFTSSDMKWAKAQLIRLRLSHNVESMDCLIAAPAYRLQLPLYTQNLKHFAPLLGALAQKPY